jgi:hypothetical protein
LKLLEEAKFGGLSNVGHRWNIAGETHINYLKYEEGKVTSYDTSHVMTHVIGVDFNSLYPSVGASILSDLHPYHNGKMCMPGRFLYRYIYQVQYFSYQRISNVFFIKVKGHFPKEKYNQLINFPPIIRPFYTEEDYDEMLKSNTPLYPHKDKHQKLTQLLSTMTGYSTFYCYYFWFLIDLGFIVDEYKEMSVFAPMVKVNFNKFITTFMNKRIEAKEEKND